MRLYIIYGSEASLLKNIFNDNHIYIRIFNKKNPEVRGNCTDVSSTAIHELPDIIKSLNAKNNFKTIIFIGAAFYAENKLFAMLEEDDLSKSIQSNIYNYILIVQKILKYSPPKTEKIFIYLSSFRSRNPTTGTTIYSASKAYGEILFKNIAKEYAKLNVRSTILRMGYFQGRMLEVFDDEKIRHIKSKISLGRFGESEEICSAIEFIILNKYLSAGSIDIDGGVVCD